MGGNLYLGIDLGIGSCGWALCTDTEIIGMGTRTFDVPEEQQQSKRVLTNQLRRQARGMRRVIDRRRQRMNAVRALLHRHGLLDNDGKTALASCADAPWQARAEGLERKLTPRELALALGHMAKHRGFKSNAKRDRGNDPEAGKVLSAVAKTQERLAQYRSVGELFWKHPDYQDRKRNRDGDYQHTVPRDALIAETRLLLRTQRRLGNALAGQELEDAFVDLAFTQRPLRDSWDMLGDCPFVPGQKRAAKHAPSFERFRLLSRLNTLRVDGEALNAEQIKAATADFGHQQGLSFKTLRRKLGLGPGQRFDTVAEAEEGRDVVARSGAAMFGANALYKVLGEAGWQSLLKTPALLDDIAAVLTFCESDDSIRRHLQDLELDDLVVTALMDGLTQGAFGKFKGAGHISAQAARAINEYLAQAMTYDQACEKLGWNHAQRMEGDIDDIRNPIAKKALLEGIKQVKAVVEAHRRPYGLPTHIHVEMARDMGKSLEERQEIERGIDKRTKQRDKLRAEFEELFERSPRGDDMLRFELWKEQRGESVYSGESIKHHMLVSDANLVEIDHILPWSRSGDDSPVNKTLCFTDENREKKGRTPFQWMQEGGPDWDSFVARVETNPNFKGRKKRNYLLHDLDSRKDFVSRNLNDTRYACRLLLNKLKAEFKGIDPVNIRARPGALTDRLRRAWDLQNLKKHDDGQRKADDRHHAVDALIVALTSESRLQQLTTLFQQAENLGLSTNWRRIRHVAEVFAEHGLPPKELAALQPPWPEFRAEVEAAFERITVSRAERRRARGQAHAATIRQVAERDGEKVVFERKAVEALTEKDLERIKDAERNYRFVKVLRQWIEDGKPKDSPPLFPRTKDESPAVPIRKVRLATTKKVDVEVRDGAAERGEMARVDVFRKANKKGKWEYFLVPVYPHEVATLAEPPNRAVVAHKSEDEWPEMDSSYEFLWSLYPLSWIEVKKPDGTNFKGYFRSMDRHAGAIDISPHHTKDEKKKNRGIGVKTLAEFRKFSIDRLGNRSEIQREKRTWRGAECT